MKIEATIKLEYSIDDREVAEFKSKVLEYIQEEIDEECNIALDDISNEDVEEFLSSAISEIIEESYKGYSGNTGIVTDDYFNTISFDYYGEDIRDLVREMAHQIYDNEEVI
jgi:transposase-like protein